MTKYLVSFDEGAMTFPDEELPAVAEAAHAVMRQAKAAGVWVFGGGLDEDDTVTVVGVDGAVSTRPSAQTAPNLGGFSIVDVPTLEEALGWAAKFAVACRCAQDVRRIMDDPLV